MAKATKTRWKTLLSKTWGDKQSHDYHEILLSGEHKLQIRLHHDYFYPERQSYARIERWDGTQWHKVAFEGQPSFGTSGVFGTASHATTFKPMRDKLLAEAEAILF